MVADERDKDAAMTDRSTVSGVVDVMRCPVEICVFAPIKSYVPRLFTKKLNEPTARSIPDSNPTKVS